MGYDTSVDELTSITDDEIMLFKYKDDENNIADPHHFVIAGKLHKWRAFMSHRAANGESIAPEELVGITYDDYLEWKRDVYFPKNLSTIGAPPSSGSLSREDIWNHRVKRDPSVFPVLKQDSQWDSWHRSTVARAS